MAFMGRVREDHGRDRGADDPHAEASVARPLRGLSGKVLSCGCFIGIYETPSGAVVAAIDACGPACMDPGHQLDALVPSVFPATSHADSFNAPSRFARL